MSECIEAEQEPLVLENIWIPMRDGVSLAAKIWLPPDAYDNPVPAILEYIPYRKRDHKAVRDAPIHGFFAQNGYAGVRVDIRGSGDSHGLLQDEYLQQELDDGLAVLKWIAEQPWCTGKVGLFGLSWGGFNGLQLAALQPPELGAVITVCSSDDRYADDVHYMGGCLLTDNLSWASTMFAYNSCPPDPAVVGESWKDMWIQRLEGSGLWIKKWLDHQRRDGFWKHASISENYDAIQVPVMAVSGWADGYTNAVFRLLKNLNVPRRGLIGPWGHRYPHMTTLGPSVDFLGEAVRWWDQWLKDIDRGVDDDPMLRAWMMDTVTPLLPRRPGRWIAEDRWPSPNIQKHDYSLKPGWLYPTGDTPPPTYNGGVVTIQSPLSVGLFAGKWASYSEDTDLPWDQRAEDGGALVFDTEPLEEDLEILGAPEVELELSADRPVAMVAVRLSDIKPDDRATRVTFGVLNLTHRNSHEHPEPLEPSERYCVRVPLNYVAQRFPAGNRIRVAISSSYWPLAWPSPEPTRLTFYLDNCKLTLPVRPSQPKDDNLRNLGEARDGPALNKTLLAPAKREWTVTHNLASNEVTLNVTNNDAHIRLEDIGLSFGRNACERYTYINNDYNTVRGEVWGERHFEREDWQVRTVTHTMLSSTRTHFLIRATLDAYEGDVRIFSKSWDEKIPRDNV